VARRAGRNVQNLGVDLRYLNDSCKDAVYRRGDQLHCSLHPALELSGIVVHLGSFTQRHMSMAYASCEFKKSARSNRASPGSSVTTDRIMPTKRQITFHAYEISSPYLWNPQYPSPYPRNAACHATLPSSPPNTSSDTSCYPTRRTQLLQFGDRKMIGIGKLRFVTISLMNINIFLFACYKLHD